MAERERARERLHEMADVIAGSLKSVAAQGGPTDTAVDLLELSGAAVMLADASGLLNLVVSSDERTQRFQQLELDRGDGPALTASRTGHSVQLEVHELGDRWPDLEAAARASRFGSVSAIPLDVADGRNSVMSLFGPAGRAPLEAAEFRLAKALGELAVVGVLQSRVLDEASTVIDQLTTALESRVAVEQAKGILADRHGVTVAVAFDMLRTYSRSTRESLVSVAEAIAAGKLDAGVVGRSASRSKPLAVKRST